MPTKKTKKSGAGSQSRSKAKLLDAQRRMDEYLQSARDHLGQATEIADEWGLTIPIDQVLGESVYPNVVYFGKCPDRSVLDAYGYAPDGTLWVDAEDAWYDEDTGKMREEAELRECEWVSSSRNCA